MKHLKNLATLAGLWAAVIATGFAFMYQYTLLAETLAWGIGACLAGVLMFLPLMQVATEPKGNRASKPGKDMVKVLEADTTDILARNRRALA
nr:MAG TPA: hypothetical protein [Caudoviricetes sp.]